MVTTIVRNKANLFQVRSSARNIHNIVWIIQRFTTSDLNKEPQEMMEKLRESISISTFEYQIDSFNPQNLQN